MDTYTLMASAGDVILVGMSRSSGSLWPGIEVHDSGGAKLCEAGSSASAEIASCELVDGGTYSILAFDYWNGTHTGDYYLYLQRLNNPGSPVSITFGQTLSGSIVSLAQMHTYTFTASAGDVVLVGMSDDSYTFDPKVRLYGPDGSLANSNWSSGDHAEFAQTLSIPGSYTILAGENGGNDTADYGLFLQRVNNPGTAPPYGGRGRSCRRQP